MAAAGVVFVEGVAAIALIVAGTAMCVRFLAAAETVFGVRSSALALVIPIFGPAGCAVVQALQPHHSIRAISMGFSLASAATLLIAGAWSIWLGIRSINARIFQYFLLSVPIPIVSEWTLADSKITHFEAFALILIYVTFVGSAWWLDRLGAAPVKEERAQRLNGPALAALFAGVAITVVGSAWLLGRAHLALLDWHRSSYASSFAGLGTIAQIATFVWLSMRRQRSELAVAGVVGTLAFNSTVTLGVFGLTAHHNWIDPSAYTIEAIATLLVPAVLFPLAFKQTKRLSGRRKSDSDLHMDNIFAWRNLKRDLSNYQLLHHRNVDGNLVTGMNSGTHWVTVMLATAIAKHHGLALPKYFSFTAAGDLVGIPSALVRRPGIPAIALSHNHPAAPLAWPIVRKLLPIPKQVVLVRDIREVMISAYVKWFPEREIPFSDFVRGDPTNRRGYLCDVWWYISYLNRWGDVRAGAPDETLVVRYEDMVAEPALWLRRISDHFALNLSDHAIEAALALRDKDAALARRDPNDTERIIAAPEAKSDVRFSEADLCELRSILSRHLRYDYGYDYGLKDTPLIPIRGLELMPQDDLPEALVPQMLRARSG
ncbi:MAG TPA: sulfotransferase [Rhizomicrobium sp.]|nr:sulfotransferase [Rhizomicrobium sp.]